MRSKVFLILALLLLPLTASGFNWKLFDDFTGQPYDLRDDFSTDLAAGSVNGTLSTSGHVRTVVDTYATTELVTNGGFETVTSAGPPANFGTWTEVVGDGNIEDATGAGEFRSGSHAVKITSGALSNTSILNVIPVIGGKTYTLSLYSRGDGTYQGRYVIRDATNATFLQSDGSWGSIATGIFTTGNQTTSYGDVITKTFVPVASCASIGIYLYSPSTNGGIAYFDDVSVLPTSGLLSITGGNLSFSGGRAASGDPRIVYPGQLRVPGKMLIHQYTGTAVKFSTMGFDAAASGGNFYQSRGITFSRAAGSANFETLNTENAPAIPFATGSWYGLTTLRSTGAFQFFKEPLATNWKLYSVGTLGNTATMYPAFDNFNDIYTSSYIGIPSTRWLPTPLLSHGFASVVTPSDGAGIAETTGLGSGGSGVTMTGATWSIVGGKAVNTPTEGEELVTNGGMEGTYVAGVAPNNTISRGNPTESADVHGGTAAQSIGNPAGDGGYFYKTGSVTAGNWYIGRVYGKCASGTGFFKSNNYSGSNIIINNTSLSGSSYVLLAGVGRAPATETQWFQGWANSNASANANLCIYDDMTVKPLTLSTLFLTAPLSTSNVVASADLTITAGTQAGLGLRLDSASTPTKGLVAHNDGVTCKLDQFTTATTWTNLISAACTYSAGAKMVAITDGISARLYYNNALIGTTASVDAGITGTIHGLFSTSALNSIDNLVIYARGNEGQYSNLNAYIQ